MGVDKPLKSQGIIRAVLSHHGAEHRHHCYRLGSGPNAVFLCARCLGVYPVLLLVVGLEGALGIADLSHRWLLAAALITPTLIDWSRSQLFKGKGSNVLRTLTGALAGLGLGLAFSDYFRDPSRPDFWILIGCIAAVAALVWWCRDTA